MKIKFRNNQSIIYNRDINGMKYIFAVHKISQLLSVSVFFHFKCKLGHSSLRIKLKKDLYAHAEIRKK